eukprot:m.105506 g.105506  ORF g.105506 m.105506 type:complete len:73 (-) comp16871_c0_seq2:63-281(-)
MAGLPSIASGLPPLTSATATPDQPVSLQSIANVLPKVSVEVSGESASSAESVKKRKREDEGNIGESLPIRCV